MNLITAARGEAHITPQDDASIYRAIVGAASGIFNWQSGFEPEVVSNNEISIASGCGMNQGRMFVVEPGTTDSVTIDSGTQGYKRIDIICQRIQVNSGAGTQSGDWYVLKGTPTTGAPVAPTVTPGDLDSGDTTALMGVVQVELNGINITAVSLIANVLDDISTLNTRLSNIWQYKTASRAIGYGANVTLRRYGPLVIISGIPKYTEAPAGDGAWTTLDEKIPEGYRPASQCDFFFDRPLGGTGGVLYEFSSNGNIRIQPHSIGADWFNAFAVWFTNDAMPN